MDTYSYSESSKYFERALKVIPCGIYGHFGAGAYVPVTDYPFFGSRALGSKFWDVDGNEFIDYMCAYGPMILGYANPVVEEAYQAQMKQADSNSIASPRMVELAEFMVDMIPIADWAFFAKNGADVTNYAIMVARAATGGKKTIAIKGHYHGTSPWMQAIGHHGVVPEDHANVIRIPWNDVDALDQAIQANEGDVAAFIATPYHHPVFGDSVMPAEGYWQKVQQLLNKNHIPLIIDDVRCGFRLDLGGSCEHFGFKADMIAYCKAIGNGYPISALVGREEFRTAAAKTFHTGSYWYSAGPMAAALATLKELKRLDGPNLLRATGKKLNDGLVAVAKSHGYDLKVTGDPGMAYYRITDDDTLMLQQDWCGECTKRGAFLTSHHNWFVSTAHTDEDIQRTWDICDDAFKVVKQKYS